MFSARPLHMNGKDGEKIILTHVKIVVFIWSDVFSREREVLSSFGANWFKVRSNVSSPQHSPSSKFIPIRRWTCPCFPTTQNSQIKDPKGWSEIANSGGFHRYGRFQDHRYICLSKRQSWHLSSEWPSVPYPRTKSLPSFLRLSVLLLHRLNRFVAG
jgi:hypothetical protein